MAKARARKTEMQAPPVASKPAPPLPPTREETIAGIAAKIASFWGDSPGRMGDLGDLEAEIRAAGLTQTEILDTLLPAVPAGVQGTTGQRCERTILMLRRVAGA